MLSHTARRMQGALRACCIVLFCAAAAMGARPVDVQVLSSAPDQIVLQANLRDFDLSELSIDGQIYSAVSLRREAPMLIFGQPELPTVVRSLMVPTTGSFAVGIDPANSSYYEIENVSIAPSKGLLYRTEDPETVPYVFDEALYATDAYYPGPLAELSAPYILRDTRGVSVKLYPFQYNPVQRTLRVYTTLTAIVRVVSGRGDNELRNPRPADETSLAFEDVYAQHYINYDTQSRYAPLIETGGMLIICHDPWLPNIAPLVAHKNAIGIPTEAVAVSSIGNNSTAIKNYIQNRYNQGNLAFVLLVGDAAQIATPQASGGASDPSYAKVAGADNYPDIMVGRFSAETAAQVDTQVLRTIQYEQNQHVLADWFKKGTGIASSEGAGIGDDGEADWQHMDNIRALLLSQGGYTQVDQIYATNGGTAAMVTTALNAGRGIINYCGHGSSTSWSTTGFSNSNVNALANDNKLPFIVSVACVNGEFAGQTCFAEAWLRATRNGQPTGAVVAYMSSINQSWAPPMEAQDEIADLIIDPSQPYHSVGALLFAGSCSMIDKYGSGGADMYNTWHIFGDPSLRVVGTTAPPSGMSVTPADGLVAMGQAGGPFLGASKVYSLKNNDASPMSFAVDANRAWVSATPPAGVIPPGETVQVTIWVNPIARNLGNGVSGATVTFTNLSTGEGNAHRDVTLTIGGVTKVREWNLDASPGWFMQGQWAYGTPTGAGGGYGYPDPQAGFTGTKVYGVNLNGNYSTTPGGAYVLRTAAIDLTGVTQTALKFRRWLNSDGWQYVQNTVDVSRDNATWTRLWNNGSTAVQENAWSLQAYDISAVADDQPTVYIRWTYKVLASAWPYSGWNIDDVEIWGLPATGPLTCYGDLNCDGAVDFDDIDRFIESLSYPGGTGWPHDCAWIRADTNGDGAVSFDDIDWFVASLGFNCP